MATELQKVSVVRPKSAAFFAVATLHASDELSALSNARQCPHQLPNTCVSGSEMRLHLRPPPVLLQYIVPLLRLALGEKNSKNLKNEPLLPKTGGVCFVKDESLGLCLTNHILLPTTRNNSVAHHLRPRHTKETPPPSNGWFNFTV
jgi:hypothetical protein